MYKYFSNIIENFLTCITFLTQISLRSGGQVLIYDQIEIAHKIFT